MLDVAIMASGSVENVFLILAANGKGITDAPHVNDDYTIPQGMSNDTTTLKYLQQNNIVIGTGDDPNLYIGIGYWQVEVDFKVS